MRFNFLFPGGVLVVMAVMLVMWIAFGMWPALFTVMGLAFFFTFGGWRL